VVGGGAGGTGSGGTLLMNCVPSETCKQYIYTLFLDSHNWIW